MLRCARQVYDDEIVQKWRHEAITLDPDEPVESEMTETMFKYALDELRHRASLHDTMPSGAA